MDHPAKGNRPFANFRVDFIVVGPGKAPIHKAGKNPE